MMTSVLVGGLAAGSSAAGPTSFPSASIPSASGTPTAPGPIAGTDPDPAAWHLPLEAYRPSWAQESTIGRAESALVEQCMNGLGVTWRRAPEIPRIGPRTLTDWRYGIHDAELSAARGYKPDAAEQARYDAALRAQQAEPTPSTETLVALGGVQGLPPEEADAAAAAAGRLAAAGRRIPQEGCYGEARRTLGSATRGVSALVRELSSRSFAESQTQPEVREVFARWSSCMRGQGYDYAAPMDANDDARFAADPHIVTPLETATASADIVCRRRTGVAEIWFGAESKVQRRLIAENATRLAADRSVLDHVLRTTADILDRQPS
ncbi:hypothetical protein [Kitasatospora paranensis]|uniref:Secreted protein n=1 Tax=Kitasatospora paranensis TaxID=258053 RepID=A0ABW2FSM8_9ACTN